MLSESICDKDLQPVQANCQKRLMFTSKFLGLVCIYEPQDWLASSAGLMTNCLWHHLHSTQLQATFYFARVAVLKQGVGERRSRYLLWAGLSILLYNMSCYKVTASQTWQMGSMCNQLASTCYLFFFLDMSSIYYAVKRREWTYNSWIWAYSLARRFM